MFLRSLIQHELAFIFILILLSDMHCSYINQELGSNLSASLGRCWWRGCGVGAFTVTLGTNVQKGFSVGSSTPRVQRMALSQKLQCPLGPEGKKS